MKEAEILLNKILVKIASEISITPSMVDKAIQSYKAVGNWIGDGIDYDTQVSPQGSMNLGTTIKPVSDKDDYDIDLVCMLADGSQLKPGEIKNIVGDRLKENKIYEQKIAAEGEGRRCWKMQYDEFHMDILPCVPKTIYWEPNVTDIRLTHKNDVGLYENRFSNPYGYRRWFEDQMKDVLHASKNEYAVRNGVDIKEVPTFRVRTPLQMAVQLLKRHRDIMFENDTEDLKPISVIITTLAGHAYSGEENLYEALVNILDHMTDFVEIRNGVVWIPNPVMSEENFADKWQQYPERRQAFMAWISEARNDLITLPLSTSGLDRIKELYSAKLGEAPVNRAFNQLGEEIRKSKETGNLVSVGSGAGLTTEGSTHGQVVRGHTFFGE
jgi:hypothetical protein